MSRPDRSRHTVCGMGRAARLRATDPRSGDDPRVSDGGSAHSTSGCRTRPRRSGVPPGRACRTPSRGPRCSRSMPGSTGSSPTTGSIRRSPSCGARGSACSSSRGATCRCSRSGRCPTTSAASPGRWTSPTGSRRCSTARSATYSWAGHALGEHPEQPALCRRDRPRPHPLGRRPAADRLDGAAARCRAARRPPRARAPLAPRRRAVDAGGVRELGGDRATGRPGDVRGARAGARAGSHAAGRGVDPRRGRAGVPRSGVAGSRGRRRRLGSCPAATRT